MRLVVIESPYAHAGNVEHNTAYARAAVKDCLARGESPYASHLFFTQPGVLDDMNPEERRLGMEAGFAWGAKADAVVVYRDLGISSGMRAGIERAEAQGQTIEYRNILGWEHPSKSGAADEASRAYAVNGPVTGRFTALHPLPPEDI